MDSQVEKWRLSEFKAIILIEKGNVNSLKSLVIEKKEEKSEIIIYHTVILVRSVLKFLDRNFLFIREVSSLFRF